MGDRPRTEHLRPRRSLDMTPVASTPLPITEPGMRGGGRPVRWIPKRVVVTPSAAREPHGRRMIERLEAIGLPIDHAKSDRITGVNDRDVRKTYRNAKSTLAIVNAPKGQFRLQPIPPSADWQFHLAQGCPAHCQYCYLAGSLSGPPVVRAYANLDSILQNLSNYAADDDTPTTFEVSCYTDPLGVEHLTGSLSRCIEWFGKEAAVGMGLRWVSKFASVDPLIGLDHRRRTRCRFSVNADAATSSIEGGTDRPDRRLDAARRLADAGYPVGLVIAPIMPTPDWQRDYDDLLNRIAERLGDVRDVTFELITHRFTPGSKRVLLDWYPKTRLDLEESTRAVKRNKFGGTKYVYPKAIMSEMKSWFAGQIEARFASGSVLYWT